MITRERRVGLAIAADQLDPSHSRHRQVDKHRFQRRADEPLERLLHGGDHLHVESGRTARGCSGSGVPNHVVVDEEQVDGTFEATGRA